MKSSKLFILLVALALLSACGGESESPAEPRLYKLLWRIPRLLPEAERSSQAPVLAIVTAAYREIQMPYFYSIVNGFMEAAIRKFSTL